jgi:hypothetical protein
VTGVTYVTYLFYSFCFQTLGAIKIEKGMSHVSHLSHPVTLFVIDVSLPAVASMSPPWNLHPESQAVAPQSIYCHRLVRELGRPAGRTHPALRAIAMPEEHVPLVSRRHRPGRVGNDSISGQAVSS